MFTEQPSGRTPKQVFAYRMPHIVVCVGAVVPLPTNLSRPEDGEGEVRKWADGLIASIEAQGLTLEGGYVNFTPPEQCDPEVFYGKQRAARLKTLKKKVRWGKLVLQVISAVNLVAPGVSHRGLASKELISRGKDAHTMTVASIIGPRVVSYGYWRRQRPVVGIDLAQNSLDTASR